MGSQIWRSWNSCFHLGAWICCGQRPQKISECDLTINPVRTGLGMSTPMSPKAEAKRSEQWWEREAHVDNNNFPGLFYQWWVNLEAAGLPWNSLIAQVDLELEVILYFSLMTAEILGVYYRVQWQYNIKLSSQTLKNEKSWFLESGINRVPEACIFHSTYAIWN